MRGPGGRKITGCEGVHHSGVPFEASFVLPEDQSLSIWTLTFPAQKTRGFLEGVDVRASQSFPSQVIDLVMACLPAASFVARNYYYYYYHYYYYYDYYYCYYYFFLRLPAQSLQAKKLLNTGKIAITVVVLRVYVCVDAKRVCE